VAARLMAGAGRRQDLTNLNQRMAFSHGADIAFTVVLISISCTQGWSFVANSNDIDRRRR
jgi:hypothetical protein